MEFYESINDAIALLENVKDPSHGLPHARGVLDLAKNISVFYSVDEDLLEVACWWHDTGVVGGHKNYEILSASLAYDNLATHGFNRQLCRKVYDMIRYHRASSLPRTIEGKILMDADKLDLISVDRWRQCIDMRNTGRVRDLAGNSHIIKIIPKMRNRVLLLENSRIIFDQMIADFLDFLYKSSDPEIKSYFNELISRAML